jgi:hypothetical protein
VCARARDSGSINTNLKKITADIHLLFTGVCVCVCVSASFSLSVCLCVSGCCVSLCVPVCVCVSVCTRVGGFGRKLKKKCEPRRRVAPMEVSVCVRARARAHSLHARMHRVCTRVCKTSQQCLCNDFGACPQARPQARCCARCSVFLAQFFEVQCSGNASCSISCARSLSLSLSLALSLSLSLALSLSLSVCAGTAKERLKDLKIRRAEEQQMQA